MFLAKTPLFLPYLYPSCIWKIPNPEKKVFLSFDDGPTPNVTDKTLSILKAEDVVATFFCVGEQIDKNPILFKKIEQDGHAIGNHTYDHVNGWKTKKNSYLNNIQKCQSLTKTNLFRPPYGKIRNSQLKKVKQDYKVIMWDVAGGDFVPHFSAEDVLKNVVRNTESGSIIVLHDNIKFGEKMLSALPEIIKQLKEKGFLFCALSNDRAPF